MSEQMQNVSGDAETVLVGSAAVELAKSKLPTKNFDRNISREINKIDGAIVYNLDDVREVVAANMEAEEEGDDQDRTLGKRKDRRKKKLAINRKVQQLENSSEMRSNKRFCSQALYHHILKKVQKEKKLKMFVKLRGVNRKNNQEFKEGIKHANAKYENLQSLSKSEFSKQIEFLKVNVIVEPSLYKLHNEKNYSLLLDDLRYISHEQYLINQKSVKLCFIKGDFNDQVNVYIILWNNFKIQGLQIQDKNQKIKCIYFRCHKHNLTISDSKFSSLELDLFQGNEINLQNVNFNSVNTIFRDCNSIKLHDICAQNCKNSIEVFSFFKCPKVNASDIDVSNCQGKAFFFDFGCGFKIKNVKTFRCDRFLHCTLSKGKFENVKVIENRLAAVLLKNSKVHYKNFQNFGSVGNFIPTPTPAPTPFEVWDYNFTDPSEFVEIDD